jgi:hypothetical protein
MKVVDLFCGMKGWSEPFRERGHEVWTTDINPRFEPSLAIDILDLSADTIRDAIGQPDIILASPPCESFSVAGLSHHWAVGGIPISDAALHSVEMVQTAVRLVAELAPRAAIFENPMGMLRKLDIIPIEPTLIWYCHYGETRAKPTDLWGLPFPRAFTPRPVCHYRRKGHTPPCCCTDHDAAPRGARTGTQGINTYEAKSLIPRELALDVCLAME